MFDFSHHNKHHPRFEIFSYLHLFATNITAPLGWKYSMSKNKNSTTKKVNIKTLLEFYIHYYENLQLYKFHLSEPSV